MAQILIAEGEAELAEMIRHSLTLAGHSCRFADTGAEALAALQGGSIDLALLDVQLPGMDGLAVLAERPDSSVPVLLMAKKSNLADRARGVSLGAAGYLLKPLDFSELAALVYAALKDADRAESRFALDGTLVDLGARTVCTDGEPVELTAEEYSLLEALIVNRNLALSRERLLTLAWGPSYAGPLRTVDVHIQLLRKKLGFETRIKTVYKLGYRLETDGASLKR